MPEKIRINHVIVKKILITGGAGFIGSHTVDALLEKGFHVSVMDNLATGQLSNLPLAHPHLKWIQQDILDYDAVLENLKTVDAVLHLAALPSVTQSIEDPIESLRINTQGFLHILQGIREISLRQSRNIRLVYASSAAVYGANEQLPCDDNAALTFSALSPYALEKANNERYADLFGRLFGISSLGLRYFNVYGIRQDPLSPYSGVIAKFLQTYQEKGTVTFFGDGMQSRDFIHVSDVARANILALQHDYQGIMNIATGQAHTLQALVTYIEQAGGKSASRVYLPKREGDITTSYANISKAEEILRFKAITPFPQGIQELLSSLSSLWSKNQV